MQHHSTKSHSSISFSPAVAQAINEIGYETWTPIQEKALPLILEGKDIIGQSHTGSGKTAAFGLPIVEKMVPNGKIQALVLVPTRELCEQVMQELRKFAKHKRMSISAVYGGVGIGPQIQHLRRTDIVVGTPGRVLDHLNRGTFQTSSINTLVLDEADRMFDMGFIRDMKKIMQRIPTQRQTLLFSATMSEEVRQIANQYMKHPEMVKTESYVDKGKLEQVYYDLDKNAHQKFGLLMHVLNHEKPVLTIVFCGTRRNVDAVERNLNAKGIKAQAIHGGLSQNQRKRTLDEFHGGKFHVLVASDVAARGLDIKNVSHVINYDIPRTASEYIHRSGRTARAGEEGKIISLLVPNDYDFFRQVLRDKSLQITELPIPTFDTIEFDRKIKKESRVTSDHGHRPSHGRGDSHTSHGPSKHGQRFFPKKSNDPRRMFGKPKPFGSKPFGSKPFGKKRWNDAPSHSPDAHPKRKKPHFQPDDEVKITRHFSQHKAPKD